MSIPALNWALPQNLKPAPKLVLLALAHRHHQRTGQCNPSLARLMADTGLSRSAVKTALRSLVALTLVRIHNRKCGAHDEEPPMDVYGECLIRTATTDGLVMLTFTPLDGLSEVVMGFMPKEMRIDLEP